jgi:predicted deacylase
LWIFAVRQPFIIGGLSVEPGERRLVDLPISKLSNHAPVTLPVHVLHGLEPGPTMFVSAAIHGDELNGVEIIRRLLRTTSTARSPARPRARWRHGSRICF